MFGQMITLKLIFCIIQLIPMINLAKSQNVCLDNSVLTCYCQGDMEHVSCIGKNETNDSFVDWAAFTSANHRQYSFTFINLTRLTYLTFTNFSLAFSLNNLVIQFTFIDGLDEIGENAFRELDYYSSEPIDITFTSPQNFKLADYAFGRVRYFEIIIDSIQYSHIHNLPYKFNLKSMDGARFYQMSVINSGEMQFVSDGPSTIELTQITVTNCSLTDASLLIESLSTALVDLDLSSNHLIEIPSMENFQEMREIDLKNNFIEEIPANIFDNMVNLWRLDLSNNRIKNIASNSFVGLTLITLDLNNNFLTSLETITTGNETTSFLYPLNQSLAFFGISNNLIRDLNPLKYMINLDNVTSCCNQIKILDANIFGKASRLESVDLSYNQIEFIDSMAFNGTIIQYLNLAGNPLSSLETNFHEMINQTTSFLYTISSTIQSLTFTNCTNLIEINWFVITKLQILFNLDLSGLNKMDKFWLYQKTDVNSEDSIINWNYPPGLNLALNGIRLTDNDYCLTKAIDHILNKTTLFVDIDHPCNCFIFKFKDLFHSEQRPSCLLNDFILDELSNRCADIDLFCESSSSSTTISPFTEWTTSLSINSTRLTLTPMTTFHTETTMTTVLFTANTIHQSSASSNVSMTMTSTSELLKQPNGDQQKKIILATIIPIVFIIMLCLTIVYILKRRKMKKLAENFEMQQKILHTIDEE